MFPFIITAIVGIFIQKHLNKMIVKYKGNIFYSTQKSANEYFMIYSIVLYFCLCLFILIVRPLVITNKTYINAGGKIINFVEEKMKDAHLNKDNTISLGFSPGVSWFLRTYFENLSAF